MAMPLPMLRCCSRSISFTNAFISKYRLLSTAVERNVKLSKSDIQALDKDAEYPPIKPKFPPGQWGDMEHTYAWLWQKSREDLLNIPDVEGRMAHLNSSEMTCINAITHSDHPDYLQFAQYVSKTHLLHWNKEKPNVYAEIQATVEEHNFVEKIKQILIDQIVMESELILRDESLNKQRSFSRLILRCIADSSAAHLSDVCEHLRTCMYDEDVIVRTLWDRHGIERQRRVRTGVDGHFDFKTVQDQRIISSCVFDGMLRSDLPLPQFAPRDSGISVESDAPELNHKYFTYGAPKNTSAKLKNLIAGHNLGDPCEYGLIGFVSTHSRGESLDQKFGLQRAKDCRLGRGLLMTFSWLAAQAYNQGFSGLVDLTYPLTSQTVMGDGRRFSVLACQLNTLALWNSNDANRMVNLCWHSDEMTLFDRVENGQVKGFNDETLKTLISMFLLQPAHRGYDMKPTITEKDDNLHLKGNFIPQKEEYVEEIVKEEEFIV